MPNPTFLLDPNDVDTKRALDRSNRLTELRAFLGREITDKIEPFKGSLFPSKMVAAAMGLAGAGIGAGIPYRHAERTSRRIFLGDMVVGTLMGGLIGVGGTGIFYFFNRQKQFATLVTEELPKQYPGKQKEILEYVHLKYPTISL